MRNLISISIGVFCLFLSINLFADQPSGSAYLGGTDSKYALILCHGRGKHPKWKVVDPLRKGVHDNLGWHTLSLQMPAESKDWKKYADDFSQAYEMIQAGISYLRNEKGVETIFLMGHSMGSRMASAFVADNPDQSIKGLIVAGIRNSGGYPLDGKQNLENVEIPVLDIWGDGGNGKDSNHASDREDLVSEQYKQVAISGANHKFDGYEDEFVSAVVDWLKDQK